MASRSPRGSPPSGGATRPSRSWTRTDTKSGSTRLFLSRGHLPVPRSCEMPFNEALADRIRKRMAARSDIVERKMSGGLAFLVRGHMCFGIIGSDLIVRVGPDDFER